MQHGCVPEARGSQCSKLDAHPLMTKIIRCENANDGLPHGKTWKLWQTRQRRLESKSIATNAN